MHRNSYTSLTPLLRDRPGPFPPRRGSGIGDTAREGLPGEVGHCCHPEREQGAAPSLSGFLAGRDRVWVCRAKRGRRWDVSLHTPPAFRRRCIDTWDKRDKRDKWDKWDKLGHREQPPAWSPLVLPCPGQREAAAGEQRRARRGQEGRTEEGRPHRHRKHQKHQKLPKEQQTAESNSSADTQCL